MDQEQIIEHIKSKQAAGVDRKDIIRSLIMAGVSQEQIIKTFKVLYANKTTTNNQVPTQADQTKSAVFEDGSSFHQTQINEQLDQSANLSQSKTWPIQTPGPKTPWVPIVLIGLIILILIGATGWGYFYLWPQLSEEPAAVELNPQEVLDLVLQSLVDVNSATYQADLNLANQINIAEPEETLMPLESNFESEENAEVQPNAIQSFESQLIFQINGGYDRDRQSSFNDLIINLETKDTINGDQHRQQALIDTNLVFASDNIYFRLNDLSITNQDSTELLDFLGHWYQTSGDMVFVPVSREPLLTKITQWLSSLETVEMSLAPRVDDDAPYQLLIDLIADQLHDLLIKLIYPQSVLTEILATMGNDFDMISEDELGVEMMAMLNSLIAQTTPIIKLTVEPESFELRRLDLELILDDLSQLSLDQDIAGWLSLNLSFSVDNLNQSIPINPPTEALNLSNWLETETQLKEED